MRCENLVSQFVPRGYAYREVKLRCGSTSVHGTTLLCEACHKKHYRQHPQGWRDTPGDVCKHGTYVGDAGGHDYLCGACEAGDD